MTVSQFGVLEALHHLGPLRQGEISAKLLRSGGNITLVVDNLEGAAWYSAPVRQTIAASLRSR